jgi:hypothetical protein
LDRHSTSTKDNIKKYGRLVFSTTYLALQKYGEVTYQYLPLSHLSSLRRRGGSMEGGEVAQFKEERWLNGSAPDC